MAATIGPILDDLLALRDQGVLDQVVVVDAASADGTAALAATHGAQVLQQAELLPEFGPVLGKGDAMWRALSVLTGDVVCFLDADSGAFGPHFCCGLVGPLVCGERPMATLQYVKGFYRRPFSAGGVQSPDGGGRVTELCARPLLARFYPELRVVAQPLAGEMAGRRSLLERLPFCTGYGVEVGLLIDAWAEVGLTGLGQCDLDVRVNAHQPLAALGPMADEVLAVVCSRLARDGRLAQAPAVIERPALASLPEAA